MTDLTDDELAFSRHRRIQRGLSIVDLMVGMTVGLIAALAIVQVYSNSESHRRSTSGAADAQQAGTLASWQLMRDLRMAGAGMQHGATLWGCGLTVWRNGNALLPRPDAWPVPFGTMPAALPLAPLAVLDGGGGNPDQILSMSARSGAGPTAMPVSIVSAAMLNTSSSVGFNPGDFLLIADPSPRVPIGACRLGQVDAGYAAIAGLPAPSMVPTGAANSAYNGPQGFGNLPLPRDYVMFNLGGAPSIQMHGVLDNQLVQYDVLQFGGLIQPVVQAEHVENLQVVYGVDDGAGGIVNDNIIDRWVSPATAGFNFAAMVAGDAGTLQVKAIRIALVMRAPERSLQMGPATLVLFQDLPAAAQVTLNYSPAERMFARQVYDLAVPLRNQSLALCAEARRIGNVPAAGVCG